MEFNKKKSFVKISDFIISKNLHIIVLALLTLMVCCKAWGSDLRGKIIIIF